MSDETENATKVDEFPAWQQAQMRAAWDKWNSGAMDGGPAPTPTAALVEETLIKDALELCGTRYELQAGYKHHLLKKLAHALQRTIAERDAQRAEVLRLTGERDALAKDLARIRAVSAIAGSVARWDSLLNDMHKQKAKVSELTATRDLLLTENAQLQQMLSRPDPVVHETPVDGVVPCCGQKLHNLKDGSRVNEGPLVNCDRMRLLTRVSELSSANLVLTAENARVHERVATLELLRRGGK